MRFFYQAAEEALNHARRVMGHYFAANDQDPKNDHEVRFVPNLVVKVDISVTRHSRDLEGKPVKETLVSPQVNKFVERYIQQNLHAITEAALAEMDSQVKVQILAAKEHLTAELDRIKEIENASQ